METTIPTSSEVARLVRSPQAQKILAELDRDAERDLDATRTRAVTAITTAQTKSEQETPKLRANLEKARRAVDDAKKALLVAQAAHAEAYSAVLNASNRTTRALGEQQEILQATTPQEAVDFIRWTWVRFDEARTTGRVEATWRTGRRDLFEKIQHHAFGNVPSVTAYIAALKAAREEVLRLVVTEPSRAKIRDRIQQLRRNLPVISEEVVVEGEP